MSHKISESILKQISSFARQNKNQEICGIIVNIDGQKKFIECENLAHDKQKFFAIDCGVYIENNVEVVVHSHCLGSASPSSTDCRCANNLELPFLIYSTIDDNFCLYENKSVIKFKV